MDITLLENQIINNDCLNVLKDMPDKSVDLVLTDPPYTLEPQGGGLGAKRAIYKEMKKYCDQDWFTDDFLSLLLSKCKFPNMILCGARLDIIKVLNFAEKKSLMYYVLPICKKNPIPFTNNTWLSNEYIFHLCDRQIDYCKNYQSKIPYFLADNQKETNHPNEKKVSIITRILSNITKENDLVLDCFSGSGTTAVACHRLKRRFICIEKDKNYYEASVKRLEDEKRQLQLF